MEDGEAVLARFNRLVRDLETGSTNRNSFQAWEIELMLDVASCNLPRGSRRRVLQRYRQAAASLIQKGAAGPLKLSEYLARRASRRGRSAPGGCAILESRKQAERLPSPVEERMGCTSVPPGGPPEERQPGQRMVFCVKFQREMPGLDEVPFEGHPLGQRIYENVSKEAWKLWLEHMKMIMNEYRLNLGTQEAQEFLLRQMEEYFFGQGAAFPPGYVPPRAKM